MQSSAEQCRAVLGSAVQGSVEIDGERRGRKELHLVSGLRPPNGHPEVGERHGCKSKAEKVQGENVENQVVQLQFG